MYPDSLLRAVTVQGEHALQLRNGIVIEFDQAQINGDWVWLSFVHWRLPEGDLPEWGFLDGIEVRFTDILWCAVNPFDRERE